MSCYLANEDGIIDQSASGGGLHDLRIAIEAGNYSALQDFIDVGATKNILLCIYQLGMLGKNARPVRQGHGQRSRSDDARTKDPGHDRPRWKEKSGQEIATAPEAR